MCSGKVTRARELSQNNIEGEGIKDSEVDIL